MAAEKPQQKKRSSKRKLRPAGLIMIAALFAFNCITSIGSLQPRRYDVEIGLPSDVSITAPYRAVNEAATEEKRELARQNTAAVYSVSQKRVDALLAGADDFFKQLDSFRKLAKEKRAATVPTETLVDGTETVMADSRAWNEVIEQSEMLTMLVSLPVSVTDTTIGYGILDADDAQISVLKELILSKLKVILPDGVTEAELEKTVAAANKELQVTTVPVKLKALGEILYRTYLQPTNIEDEVATENARAAAAKQVEPVYIPRGTVIVEKGEMVTEDQYRTLLNLDLVKGQNANRQLSIGLILYLLCIYTVLFVTLRLCSPEVFSSGKQMLLLTLILAISIALQWLCYLLEPRIIPSVFAVLLTTILISRSVAQSVNIALALSFSLLAGGNGSQLLSATSLLALASTLLSGQVTILIAERSENRGALIGAGAVGGIAGALVIVAGHIILGQLGNSTLTFAGLTIATGLILSVFCIGTLSVWENLFDIVTNARLHELANVNHPLLKKMMTSAPGTYHHCMMTASLAEGAAETIGANALLARTGAMYHDVGKLRRPQYFKENQSGPNIHDTLPPEESAGYIISHVKDTDALLNKYHMPAEVRKIASEHHGTTLAAYFFYKAKQESEQSGEPVIERLFRYPGGLPSSKESAIVMMADSCEAAVRSLNDPTQEDVAVMVHKIVQGKMNDGQLNQAPLTLQELNKIEKSFLVTFNGLLHERIRYPGTEMPA